METKPFPSFYYTREIRIVNITMKNKQQTQDSVIVSQKKYPLGKLNALGKYNLAARTRAGGPGNTSPQK